MQLSGYKHKYNTYYLKFTFTIVFNSNNFIPDEVDDPLLRLLGAHAQLVSQHAEQK